MAGVNIAQILGKIEQLDSMVVDRTLIAQIYGEAGVGKTKQALELAHKLAPEGTRILYVDSLENYVITENHPELKVDVVRFPYTKWDELGVLMSAVQKGAVKDVSVVVWDELSSISEMLLDHIVRADQGTPDDVISTEAVDPRLYKPLGDSIGKLMLETQKAGVHQIVIAHERIDRRNQKDFVSPSYSPKNRDSILKKMTVSARMTNTLIGRGDKTVINRVMQSRPTALIACKTRIGTLPFQTDPDTWADIVADWVYGEAPEEFDDSLANEAEAVPLDGAPLMMSSDDDDAPSTTN